MIQLRSRHYAAAMSVDDMPEARLPPELLERVLCALPTDTTGDSARAIARFGCCSRASHALATGRDVWQPHFTARFRRHRVRPSPDAALHLLYAQRHQADAEALGLLDETIAQPIGRLVRMARLSELGLDVVERVRDVYHAMSALLVNEPGVERPSDWLARMYYAREIAMGIDRRFAVERWRRAAAEPRAVSFEEALSLFSVFRGGSLQWIENQLDELAAECRAWVATAIDVHDGLALMKAIYRFCVLEGFGASASGGDGADRSQVPPLAPPFTDSTAPFRTSSYNRVDAGRCR